MIVHGNVPSVTGQVLVVDDHQSARESMADVLRHAGHQVAVAAVPSKRCSNSTTGPPTSSSPI